MEKVEWMDVNPEGCKNQFEFHTVPQYETEHQYYEGHELTKENYLQVLEAVLSW